MNKYRLLLAVSLAASLLSACQNQTVVKPPTGSSGDQVPLYPNAQIITLSETDRVAFISDNFGQEYLLFSSTTNISWVKDTGDKVRKGLDKLLPDANWRVESDWFGSQFSTSIWRNGDLKVLIAYLDNLNSAQINNLNKRYGLSGMEPGATLIITHVWDTTRPVPTVTMSSTPIPSLTPPSQGIPFEFPERSNSLNPEFTWQSGGLSDDSYSFGPSAGAITLSAQAGTDHFHRLELAPMILYPVEGDFETQIKVDFSPNQYYQLAGFGVRSTQDHYTWLRIAKYLTHEGQYIFFFSTNQGTTSEVKLEPYSNATIYFRIERTEDLFTVSYSPDGSNWVIAQKDYGFRMPNAVEIFLVTYSAHNSQSITAQFSDFTVSER